MASPAAVGGSLLGAGAIGVGSAYLAGAFGGLDPSEPNRVLLSDYSQSSSAYTEGDKIGKAYKNYLVAPIGSKTTGGVTTNNEAWWKWSYKRWQADSGSRNNVLSTEFENDKKINSAFSSTIPSPTVSPKALNQVCEDIYKQDKSSLIPVGNATENKTKLKNDLFKYCSILGEVKTISEVEDADYGENTKGKDATNSKKFVAVKGNDKFWEIRNKEFYGDDSGEKSKSKSTVGTSKFKAKSVETPRPKIRDICEEAYRSGKDESTDYPSAEVNIFCVL
ncbi:hypothetical protein [Candidatus Mycoplasma haematohominis]|uniref:Uncharacterized protein n=1 Tax=Candidatus Mycoplasma haematohominis TaxID=1494318 RepID=A0A478FSM6_9MOLU|nr:hypothetical protein [Candidatus Mycoplasma haemohominis]GCE63065.1 hypothetical protein MHSWG343_00430 [Candidatus Mycoplasma haemohominis]